MAKFKNYVPAGVIPACILPFHDDLSQRANSSRSYGDAHHIRLNDY